MRASLERIGDDCRSGVLNQLNTPEPSRLIELKDLSICVSVVGRSVLYGGHQLLVRRYTVHSVEANSKPSV